MIPNKAQRTSSGIPSVSTTTITGQPAPVRKLDTRSVDRGSTTGTTLAECASPTRSASMALSLRANELHPSKWKPGQQHSSEATLTTKHSSQVVGAQSLEIQPPRADGSPTAGDQKCSNYAQIDINYVPNRTSKITVHVGLKEAARIVPLYLTFMLIFSIIQNFQ